MKSRDDLLDAALRELNRRPTATMADIAAAIGVSRATLHRHFASREALVLEIAERSLDSWAAAQRAIAMDEVVASGDRDAVEAALRALLARFVQDAEDFGFTLTDELSIAAPELAARMEELAERDVAFLAAAQERGVLRRDVPARWLGQLLLGHLVAARNALREGDVARRDLDALVTTTFLDGAGPR